MIGSRSHSSRPRANRGARSSRNGRSALDRSARRKASAEASRRDRSGRVAHAAIGPATCQSAGRASDFHGWPVLCRRAPGQRPGSRQSRRSESPVASPRRGRDRPRRWRRGDDRHANRIPVGGFDRGKRRRASPLRWGSSTIGVPGEAGRGQGSGRRRGHHSAHSLVTGHLGPTGRVGAAFIACSIRHCLITRQSTTRPSATATSSCLHAGACSGRRRRRAARSRSAGRPPRSGQSSSGWSVTDTARRSEMKVAAVREKLANPSPSINKTSRLRLAHALLPPGRVLTAIRTRMRDPGART